MTLEFCSLSSGSSGNSQFISGGDTKILVDAGFSGKKIESLLDEIDVDPKELDYILVTHEHLDHIRGVGVLSRRYNLPIVANMGTWKGMEDKIGKIKSENIRVIESNRHISLGNLYIRAFDIFHDALEPVGYNIFCKDKKVSLVTDTGIINKNIENYIRKSDLYLLESNHDVEMLKNCSYPYYLKERIKSNLGHLSNEDAGNVLKNVLREKNEKVLLAHLSKDNNNPHLAYLTVSQDLEKHGIDTSLVDLQLTNRDMPTKIYKL